MSQQLHVHRSVTPQDRDRLMAARSGSCPARVLLSRREKPRDLGGSNPATIRVDEQSSGNFAVRNCYTTISRQILTNRRPRGGRTLGGDA